MARPLAAGDVKGQKSERAPGGQLAAEETKTLLNEKSQPKKPKSSPN